MFTFHTGPTQCTLNVHNIGTHMVQCVLLAGPLFTHSAFYFESICGDMATMVTGTRDPVKQVTLFVYLFIFFISNLILIYTNTISSKVYSLYWLPKLLIQRHGHKSYSPKRRFDRLINGKRDFIFHTLLDHSYGQTGNHQGCVSFPTSVGISALTRSKFMHFKVIFSPFWRLLAQIHSLFSGFFLQVSLHTWHHKGRVRVVI